MHNYDGPQQNRNRYKGKASSSPQTVYRALITLHMWSGEGFTVMVTKPTSLGKSEKKLLMLLAGSCYCSLNWKITVIDKIGGQRLTQVKTYLKVN